MTSYKERHYSIRGITPLVMANSALADPRNEYAREIAALKSKPKRQKTDADLERIQDLMWWGSLYLDKAGKLSIPAQCIMGMVKAGAARFRTKQDVRIGIMARDQEHPLKYKGPTDLEKMSLDSNFRKTFLAPTQAKGKTLSTFPIFPEWSLEFTLLSHPDVINHETLDRAVWTAGELLGFMALRPWHGRFVNANGKS